MHDTVIGFSSTHAASTICFAALQYGEEVPYARYQLYRFRVFAYVAQVTVQSIHMILMSERSQLALEDASIQRGAL